MNHALCLSGHFLLLTFSSVHSFASHCSSRAHSRAAPRSVSIRCG